MQEEHQGETMLQGYDTKSNIDCFKSKTIVDENLWTFIKEKFPDHVESAMSGCDTINVEEVFPCVPSHQFAKQGDIKEEFEDESRVVGKFKVNTSPCDKVGTNTIILGSYQSIQTSSAKRLR